MGQSDLGHRENRPNKCAIFNEFTKADKANKSNKADEPNWTYLFMACRSQHSRIDDI